MFTGIITAAFPIIKIHDHDGIRSISVQMDAAHCAGLQIGASVAINGICLSVTKLEGNLVSFDAIAETLQRTTLGSLQENDLVHVERSLTYGKEIGGHILSGHIDTTAILVRIERDAANWRGTFSIDPAWMKYILPKGFLGIHGASLTIAATQPEAHTFSVCLIPETLRITTFDSLKEQNRVNIEIDRQTQAIVDTVERVLQSRKI